MNKFKQIVIIKATVVTVAFFLPFPCYTSHRKYQNYRKKTIYPHETPENFQDAIEKFAIFRKSPLVRMIPKGKASNVSNTDYQENRTKRKVSPIRRSKKQRKFRAGRKINFKKRRQRKMR